MRDGNLRQLFQQHLKMAMFQACETWSTGQGVPDAHFCFPGGICGWIENKRTSAWAVGIEKEQSAWLEKYSRHGGRCFVAVRRHVSAGARRLAADELWLFRGRDARALMLEGLRARGIAPLSHWHGGPARWDWGQVEAALTA